MNVRISYEYLPINGNANNKDDIELSYQEYIDMLKQSDIDGYQHTNMWINGQRPMHKRTVNNNQNGVKLTILPKYTVNAKLTTMEDEELTEEGLDNLIAKNEICILTLKLLFEDALFGIDRRRLLNNADQEEEIKRWIVESKRINDAVEISDEQKMVTLPEKTFWLETSSKEMKLNKCKIVDDYDKLKIAILVQSITESKLK